jgi:hypothetical protein
MKLTKAIFYRSYPGAVLCTLSPKPAIAHICRQGGRGEVKEWYIVSVDHVHVNKDGYAYISPQKWDTMSFHTISACLKWFREHKIDVSQGWYPTRGKERWYELGSSK